MTDARFEDAHEAPLRLKAEDAEDLRIIAALVQDAVLPVTEIAWQPRRRRFAMLLNRVRWEDRGHGGERVQSLLVFDGVLKVAGQGIDRRDRDLVLSLLDIAFQPGQDGAGRVELVLAGDGALALEVECLDATLRDVTRPYRPPSGRLPDHGGAGTPDA
jgi:hypothetical protein